MEATVILVCDYSLGYLGGAQSAFLRQADALLAAGSSVVVVAPGAAKAFAGRDDARLTIIDPPSTFTIPVLGLPVLASVDELATMLAELIRTHTPTGVIVHSEFALASATLRAAKAAGVPSIHVVHTFFWHAPRLLAPVAPLVRRFHQRKTGLDAPADRYRESSHINNALRLMTLRIALEADVVASPSAHQAERLRAAGVSDVRVVSNVAVPAASEITERPLTLVWIGRFAPEKRLSVALGAMALVRERLGPGRVHLHVVGGDHAPRHDVTFYGQVPPARVGELIASADAAVLTSVGFDNQPMVILEAFARGRAVLVCDPVLHQEFGDAVLLSRTTDAAGLAELICDIHGDRDRLLRSGADAADYAARRAPAVHVERLLRILDDARSPEADAQHPEGQR